MTRSHLIFSKRRNHGFTIVELLIVIIVIAILAAIVIVAYNGMQERAKSSSVVETARAYINGLQLWAADKGVYPVPGVPILGPVSARRRFTLETSVPMLLDGV